MAEKKRSAVWCYFSPVDKVMARCEVCDKKVAHSSNTSNLFKHLKTTHPESHSELEKRQAAEKIQSPAAPAVRQKTLLESFQKGKAYPGTDSTVNQCSDKDNASVVSVPESLNIMITI